MVIHYVHIPHLLWQNLGLNYAVASCKAQPHQHSGELSAVLILPLIFQLLCLILYLTILHFVLLLLAGPPVLWFSSKLCSTPPPAFLCLLLLFFTCSSRLCLGVPLICLVFLLEVLSLNESMNSDHWVVLLRQCLLYRSPFFATATRTFYELFVKQCNGCKRWHYNAGARAQISIWLSHFLTLRFTAHIEI